MTDLTHGGYRENSGRNSKWQGLDKGDAASVVVKLPRCIRDAVMRARDRGVEAARFVDGVDLLGIHDDSDAAKIARLESDNAALRGLLVEQDLTAVAALVERDPDTADWVESEKDKRIAELEAQLLAVRALANEAAAGIAKPESPRQANLWSFLGKLRGVLGGG